jgi:hypothetical protein
VFVTLRALCHSFCSGGRALSITMSAFGSSSSSSSSSSSCSSSMEETPYALPPLPPKTCSGHPVLKTIGHKAKAAAFY